MPPLYIGTETPRAPETLRKLGFTGSEQITGMDFPQNTVKSFYWPPILFESIVRQQTQMLLDMGFRQIVWLNGHGADKQLEILQRVCKEYSQTHDKKICLLVAAVDESVDERRLYKIVPLESANSSYSRDILLRHRMTREQLFERCHLKEV